MASAALSIAVVIPALNAAAFLHTALASIAVQEVDYEGILVDGGSSDETLAIAAAHGVRVVSAPGTSIYGAINRGIAETHAAAIVLVNADDILLPGALTAWRNALLERPGCAIARGRETFVETDDAGVVVPLAPPRASGSLTIERILRGPGFINSLCIRRATFERVGLFNTKYRFAADRDWMLRASMAGVEIAEFDQEVYRYLAHAGSSTMDRLRRNHAEMRREHLDIAARYLAGPNPKNAAATPALRRWHAVETGMLTWHEACAGKIGAAVRTLGRSTRVDLSWPLHLAGETARRLTRRRA